MTATTPPAEDQPGARRYRRRPVEVEAVQVTEGNVEQVAAWLRDHGNDVSIWSFGQARLTWGSRSYAGVGDWVTVNDDGFADGLRRRDFAERYEPA